MKRSEPQDALEHGERAVLDAEVLEEEHHLEALAVDGGEAEDGEAEQRAPRGVGRGEPAGARRLCAEIQPVQ